MDDDHELLTGAEAFAKTLRGKSLADAIGQLILAFDMDVISAKALMILVHERI